MDPRDAKARRPEQPRRRRPRARNTRFAAVASLLAVAGGTAAIVLASSSGSGSHASTTSGKPRSVPVAGRAPGSQPTNKPGTAAVPILTYHVINVPPTQGGGPPALYVPADQFASQMDALKGGGWSAVTLDQVQAYWTRGTALGSDKPIVITFDGGYASQYTNALPVLKRLGWAGVENVQVNGLPPSDGGLTDSQIRGLRTAGWELDAEGNSQPELTTLDSTQLQAEVAGERQTLRSRYGAPVNWFSYPSGRYNATVTAAVRAAGFVGSTTLTAGWASPRNDRYLLPRIAVNGGTTPSQLLAQIASAKQSASPPPVSAGT